MGNEQSTGGPSSSSTGVSSSLSFLTRSRKSISGVIQNRNPTYKSPIVVVNSRGTGGNPEDDENLKKLKEIPRFQPLLKSVLPGQRDPQSVFSKIDPRYISRFLHRLQEHFSICYQVVSNQQNSLFSRITEIDQKTNNLFRRITLLGKKYDGLTNEFKKIKNVSTQLETVQLNMDGIMRDLEMLNELLPEKQRLPVLPKIAFTSNISTELATDVLVDGALLERVGLSNDGDNVVVGTNPEIIEEQNEPSVSIETPQTETNSTPNVELEQPIETTGEDASSMIKIREHPSYEKYFKMLRLGIPDQAVRIKMSSEGVDPTLLNNPDKLIEAVKISDQPQNDNSSNESDSD